MNAKNTRAQFWSLDAIFAMVLFAVVITVITFIWLNLSAQLGVTSQSGGILMQEQEQTLLGTLLTTGSPTNWPSYINTTQPQVQLLPSSAPQITQWSSVSIGLAAAPGSQELSTQKIYALLAMANHNQSDYQATKSALAIGYEYYIIIKGGSFNITIGENPVTNNAVSVYTGSESALLNGQPAQLQVDVWTSGPVAIT